MKGKTLKKILEDLEKIKEIFFIRKPELGLKLLSDLRKKGKISPDTELEDILNLNLPYSEINSLVKEGVERLKKRTSIIEEKVYCHSSPNKIEKMIDKLSCISTIKAIYLGGGRKPINYLYIVEPLGTFNADPRAPPNAKGEWFKSNGNCRIIKTYDMSMINEFIKEYPDSRFISFKGDEQLRKKYRSMEFT